MIAIMKMLGLHKCKWKRGGRCRACGETLVLAR